MSTATLTKTTNQTLGRGKLYFKKLGETGYRYIGNTPAFGLTASSETLKHYSSDQGVRVQDKEIVVQTEYSGAFTTDNINHENLAMLFLGTASSVAVSSGTNSSKTFNSVKQGYVYDLGKRNVSNVAISGKTLNTDFSFDATTGLLTVIAGGAIADDANITVTFDNAAYSYDKTITAGDAVEGSLMFISHNPEGDDIDYVIEDAKLAPNGEYQIKAQEWQQLQFNVAISNPDSGNPAIVASGRPYTP